VEAAELSAAVALGIRCGGISPGTLEPG